MGYGRRINSSSLAGPIGPAGPVGPQGPAGPAGPQGLPGTSGSGGGVTPIFVVKHNAYGSAGVTYPAIFTPSDPTVDFRFEFSGPQWNALDPVLGSVYRNPDYDVRFPGEDMTGFDNPPTDSQTPVAIKLPKGRLFQADMSMVFVQVSDTTNPAFDQYSTPIVSSTLFKWEWQVEPSWDDWGDQSGQYWGPNVSTSFVSPAPLGAINQTPFGYPNVADAPTFYPGTTLDTGSANTHRDARYQFSTPSSGPYHYLYPFTRVYLGLYNPTEVNPWLGSPGNVPSLRVQVFNVSVIDLGPVPG